MYDSDHSSNKAEHHSEGRNQDPSENFPLASWSTLVLILITSTILVVAKPWLRRFLKFDTGL
ncbi:hypothetical protein BS330_27485 [Amycolatopsis keratiniphila subsp. nogabecina]|nr:hypothetical protein BS330_27485 [Amycolatopsis keratiniphila subsp. nogabecina]